MGVGGEKHHEGGKRSGGAINRAIVLAALDAVDELVGRNILGLVDHLTVIQFELVDLVEIHLDEVELAPRRHERGVRIVERVRWLRHPDYDGSTGLFCDFADGAVPSELELLADELLEEAHRNLSEGDRMGVRWIKWVVGVWPNLVDDPEERDIVFEAVRNSVDVVGFSNLWPLEERLSSDRVADDHIGHRAEPALGLPVSGAEVDVECPRYSSCSLVPEPR